MKTLAEIHADALKDINIDIGWETLDGQESVFEGMITGALAYLADMEFIYQQAYVLTQEAPDELPPRWTYELLPRIVQELTAGYQVLEIWHRYQAVNDAIM